MLRIPTPAELRQQIRLDDLALANESDAVIRELRVIIRGYIRELQSLTSSRNRTASNLQRARDTAELGNNLFQILNDLGLAQFLEDYQSRFVVAERKALEYFEVFGIPPSYDGIDTSALDGFITFEQERLAELIDSRLVTPFRNALIQSNLGNLEPRQVEAMLQAQFDRYSITTANGTIFTVRQIETLVSDQYVRYERHVQDKKAEALGLEVYQYIGPNDNKTRASCRAMLQVNKNGAAGILRRQDITTALHPDLEEDPLVAGGGFNCRHAWHPITNEYAQSLGFNGV